MNSARELEDITFKFNTEWVRLGPQGRTNLVTLATSLASAQIHESEARAYGFVERYMHNDDDPIVRSFANTIGHTYDELCSTTNTRLTTDELIAYGIAYLAAEISLKNPVLKLPVW